MANDNETKIKVNPVEVLTVRKVKSGYVYLGICHEDGREYASAHPNGAQWDTFVAAGDRALGRKPVRDFPPGPLPRARPSTDAEIVTWMADLYREDTPIAEALGRVAATMAREAGPTVPRGAVAAIVSDIHARSVAVMSEANQSIEEKVYAALYGEADGLRKAAEMVMAALATPTEGR